MDIQMPIMDGYQATSTIRTWEREHERDATPIIPLTANAFKEDIEKRDKSDMMRKIAPLRMADDAILIDTTQLSKNVVINMILSKILQSWVQLKL